MSDIFDPTGIEDYENYLDLLGEDLRFPGTTVTMVIVPQARSAENIGNAARLAHDCGSILVSLCSHDADAGEVAGFLADMPSPPERWYAVSVPPGYDVPGVDLRAEHQIPDMAAKPAMWNLSENGISA